MIEQIISWIEGHSVTVGVITTILVGLGGAVGLLRKLNRRPKLDVYGPAGFCYVEDYKDPKSGRDARLAVFVLNPSIKNHSDRNFEIDRFYLGYDCAHITRRFRQKLFQASFPARPRKAIGEGAKILSVFFTKYGDGFDEHLSISGKIEPKSIAAAYVMFVANTWGSWTPLEIGSHIKVKLSATTVGEGTLTKRVSLRVYRDEKFLEDFCPTLSKYVHSDALWNMEEKR